LKNKNYLIHYIYKEINFKIKIINIKIKFKNRTTVTLINKENGHRI